MKNKIIWMTVAGILFLSIIHKAKAQDSATIANATINFQNGWNAYNAGDYNAAMQYLKNSAKAVPAGITYYFLGLAYCKQVQYQNALNAVNKALTANPALNAEYRNEAITLKKKLIAELQPPPAPKNSNNNTPGIGVTADAIKVPPSGKVPAASDYPHLFVEKKFKDRQSISPAKARMNADVRLENTTIRNSRFIFPGSGKKNENSQIGDFCCTGETATVLRTDGAILGYIYFYDFEGGMNIGNNRSAASKLKILLSGTTSVQTGTQERIKGQIVFDGRELYNGAEKRQRVGALIYNVKILSVQKYTQFTYYMDKINIQVDVFTSDISMKPKSANGY